MRKGAFARAAVMEATVDRLRPPEPPSHYLTFDFAFSPAGGASSEGIQLQARRGASFREAILHWLDQQL
jgi:hypothetical protein